MPDDKLWENQKDVKAADVSDKEMKELIETVDPEAGPGADAPEAVLEQVEDK